MPGYTSLIKSNKKSYYLLKYTWVQTVSLKTSTKYYVVVIKQSGDASCFIADIYSFIFILRGIMINIRNQERPKKECS